MGQVTGTISDGQRRWIEGQRMFFVATAPLASDGHVNVSPKGLDTLRVLDAQTVVYLDFTGSGAETIAHVRENGRITLMFCSFEGPPKILRLHGEGDAVVVEHPDFSPLRERFPEEHGVVRSVIRVRVRRVAESCGYGVPLFDFAGERSQLAAWTAQKGDDGVIAYQQSKNRRSIDGLPALD